MPWLVHACLHELRSCTWPSPLFPPGDAWKYIYLFSLSVGDLGIKMLADPPPGVMIVPGTGSSQSVLLSGHAGGRLFHHSLVCHIHTCYIRNGLTEPLVLQLFVGAGSWLGVLSM